MHTNYHYIPYYFCYSTILVDVQVKKLASVSFHRPCDAILMQVSVQFPPNRRLKSWSSVLCKRWRLELILRRRCRRASVLSWGKPKRHSRTSQCEFQNHQTTVFPFSVSVFSSLGGVQWVYYTHARGPTHAHNFCACVARAAAARSEGGVSARYNPL